MGYVKSTKGGGIMEEKERYELFGEHIIKDNDDNAKCQLLDTYKTYVILNQQDKQIKELEDEKKELEIKLDKCGTELVNAESLVSNLEEVQFDYKKQNQQLKRTIQTIHQNVRNGSLEDIKHIEALKEEIECWREEYNQLKQQLHDLPKKIVEEIKNELENSNLKLRIVGIDGYSYTGSFLQAILKKYIGE